MVTRFEAGDVVRVVYASALGIENWMRGIEKVGPDEVGVVKYTVPSVLNDSMNLPTYVTVTFPMLGTFAVHSSDLVVVRRVGEIDEPEST